MDFAEAFVMLEHAVAFHKAEDLNIPQAAEILAFVAKEIALDCPSIVPRICIDDELPANILGSFVVSIKIITLKHWDNSCADQGVLAHEIAHYVQQHNGKPFSEEEAERARHAWLKHIQT